MGLYIGATHSVQQLAADAARASVAGMTDVERIAIAQEHVSRNAASYMLLGAGAITAEARRSASSPDDFEVRVRYDASGLPIWQFARLFALPSDQIERAAVVRRGGF